jgi:hypothetical protein
MAIGSAVLAAIGEDEFENSTNKDLPTFPVAN